MADWIWFVGGVVLMIAELILPGLVALFMGFGAITVGILRMTLDIWQDPLTAAFAWVIISLIYILLLRSVLLRYFPQDTTTRNVEHDLDVLGSKAVAASTIEPGTPGRITFQGTSWPAISVEETIEEGTQVVIVHRDNIGWVVEPDT